MDSNSKNVVSAFIEARDALYKHLGFEKDRMMFPLNLEAIDDFWRIRAGEIRWWENTEDSDNEGNQCCADIFTLKFYPNGSIFRGSEFAMVFGHPHVDGRAWAYIFRNDKEIS
jgi:hypothetical protein